MNIKLITELAFKKIRFRKVRTLLLALPIVILSAFIITIFSWAGHFEDKVVTEYLQPLEQAKLLINISKFTGGMPETPPELKETSISSHVLNEDEASRINEIEGVELVTDYYRLPLSMDIQIESVDKDNLYTGEVLSMEASLADLYGVEDFSYNPGEPIPIIAGTSLLNETEYHFENGNVVEEPVMRQANSTEPDAVTHKSYKELINSRLIGDSGMFQVSIAPEAPIVIQEQEINKIISTKLSDERRSEIQSKIDDSIRPYWNLEELREPVNLEFKVVGINTLDFAGNASFIPNEALAHILNSLHQKQLGARTSVPIPSDLLQESILGNIVQADDVYFAHNYLRDTVYGNTFEQMKITIPGLLIKASKDASGNLSFVEVKDFNLTPNHLTGVWSVVRIKTPELRDSAMSSINEIDGLFAGGGDVDTYASIIKFVNMALQIAAALLSAVVAFIVLILCWGFATDANKEVGLLRALGITGGNARNIILWQLVIIFGASIGIGLIISFGVIYFGADWIAGMLNKNYLSQSAAIHYGRNTGLQASDINSLDVTLVLPYLAASLLLPALAAYIATRRNLKTDPLEAFKKS